MDFITLLKNRRSKRKFTTAKVEKEKIELLIQAALLSPTGKKKNHWDFIVVENAKTLEQLSFCKPHSASLIAGAPLSIVVIGDPLVSDTWIEDCSIASILIQLAAEDLGLGSCWVQVLHREHNETLSADEYVKNLLGIPSEKMVLSIIAIGYPNESKKTFDAENLLRERIHFEKY
jgi:nitroreductase